KLLAPKPVVVFSASTNKSSTPVVTMDPVPPIPALVLENEPVTYSVVPDTSAAYAMSSASPPNVCTPFVPNVVTGAPVKSNASTNTASKANDATPSVSPIAASVLLKAPAT